MSRRFLFLIGLCLFVGFVTTAFGAEQKQAPWITREGAVAMLVESKPAWRAKLDAFRKNPEPMALYTDTDPNEWYIPYLEVAFSEGLIEATDFYREFRPGELLRQGDAIALAVRYKADGDKEKLPQEEPDHPLSIPLHVQKGYDMGLQFPKPFESWNVIRRTAWNDIAASAGVVNPAAIVVTIPSKVPLAFEPMAAAIALPVTGPINLVPAQPVQQPIVQQVQQPIQQPTTGYKPVEPTYQQPVQQYPATTQTPVVSQPSNSNNPPASNGQSDSYFAIAIPSLGITDLKITHPTDVGTQQGLLAPLQTGVGHLFSYPGNGGSVLIYGHSSSVSYDPSEFTKIFRQINKLKQGDKVYISYNGKMHEYVVTHSQTVPATDLSAYQQNNGEELILYTCWPPDDVKQRYLVHAKPV